MPEGISLAACEEILTFEEIQTICRAAAELGIRKFKITGGEPLVRLGCPELVGILKRIPKTEQVTLTTNGTELGRYLDRLLENGLDAVNVSLDTLNPSVYKRITGFDKLSVVRKNIGQAVDRGLRVKVNSVLQKGVNENAWETLVRLAEEKPIDVRFIEMMPIGYGKCCEPVSGEEVLSRLRGKYPGIRKDDSIHGNGPAHYYRIPGFAGSVGFISAVHGKFCASCNRIRLTAKGELKPCLCYGGGIDVRKVIRSGEETDAFAGEGEAAEDFQIDNIKEALRKAVEGKPKMHCFETRGQITENRQMVQIGG